MRIAFFADPSSVGGIATSVENFSAELIKRGHEVDIYFPRTNNPSENTAPNIHYLQAIRVSKSQPFYWSLPFSVKLFFEFSNKKFDIIHAHFASSGYLLALQLAKMFDLPLIYSHHTKTEANLHYVKGAQNLNNLIPVAEMYDRTACNLSDLVIAPSKKIALYLESIDIKPRVKIIPNGINLQIFHQAQSEFLTQLYPQLRHKIVLLFVGRLSTEKNPIRLYKIFKKIALQNKSVALVYVGQGIEAERIIKLATNDELIDRVVLTGPIPHNHMNEVYNSAHLWVSTSTSEVHPMTALEAIACGLPAIAVEDMALDNVIVNNRNGFIVDSDEDFIEKTLILIMNKDLHASMSSKSIQIAKQFSIRKSTQLLIDAYKSIPTNVNSD